jgi:hypothetical protein
LEAADGIAKGFGHDRECSLTNAERRTLNASVSAVAFATWNADRTARLSRTPSPDSRPPTPDSRLPRRAYLPMNFIPSGA